MSFLEGNSGLSTRDVEDAFRDATGQMLISESEKTAGSEITDRLWVDYQAFTSRDCRRCIRHRCGVPVR